jgi:hypothetical protein
MSDQTNPLAAPIDRAIAAAVKAGVMDDDAAYAETLRDDVIYEIEAEFPGLRVDAKQVWPDGQKFARLTSEWRAER